jgi:hypothetical protein
MPLRCATSGQRLFLTLHAKEIAVKKHLFLLLCSLLTMLGLLAYQGPGPVAALASGDAAEYKYEPIDGSEIIEEPATLTERGFQHLSIGTYVWNIGDTQIPWASVTGHDFVLYDTSTLPEGFELLGLIHRPVWCNDGTATSLKPTCGKPFFKDPNNGHAGISTGIREVNKFLIPHWVAGVKASDFTIQVRYRREPRQTPVPLPSPAPGTTPAPIPVTQHIRVLSVWPRGNQMVEGQSFHPEVVVEATGISLNCSQDFLEYRGGERFGAWPTQGCTALGGGRYRFYFNTPMQAPTTAGSYQSSWQIWKHPNHTGPLITLSFRVGSPPPPDPRTRGENAVELALIAPRL